MGASRTRLLEAIYQAFEDRDGPRLAKLFGPGFEFHAVTGRHVGRTEPYVGAEGVEQYMKDVRIVWRELRLIQRSFEEHGNHVLVIGRVWGRSADSIVDSPAAWLWTFAGDRPVVGRAFQAAEPARDCLAELLAAEAGAG